MRPAVGLLAPAALAAAALCPRGAAAQRGPSVVGPWSCSHFAPGNFGDGSLMVMQFTLNADGTYRSGSAAGRYRFEPRSGRIDFLTGELRTLYADTRVVPDPASGRPLVRTLIGPKRRRFDCRLGR